MLTPEQTSKVSQKLMTLRIIGFAMVMGCVMFAGIILMALVNFEELMANENLNLLTLIAAGTGVLLMLMSFVIPVLFGNEVKIKDVNDEAEVDRAVGKITDGLITEKVIRKALLEAAVFINLTVLILDAHKVSIIVAVIGLVLLLFTIPFGGSFFSKVEQRLADAKRAG